MLTADKIRELFTLLDKALAPEDVIGEVYVVGGAVMTLAFSALAIVERYFPSDQIPPKTHFALEELLTSRK
jgi:hypothetical protein